MVGIQNVPFGNRSATCLIGQLGEEIHFPEIGKPKMRDQYVNGRVRLPWIDQAWTMS